MRMRWTLLPAMAGLTLGLPIASSAAESDPRIGPLAVEERFKDTTVSFDLHDATVVGADPNRFRVELSSQKGAPVIDLKDHGKMRDGTQKMRDYRGVQRDVPSGQQGVEHWSGPQGAQDLAPRRDVERVVLHLEGRHRHRGSAV